MGTHYSSRAYSPQLQSFPTQSQPPTTTNMHFTKKVAAPLAIAGFAAAAPAGKAGEKLATRNNGGYDDATILNYALTLEHLESAFYRSGLDMYNAGAFNDA